MTDTPGRSGTARKAPSIGIQSGGRPGYWLDESTGRLGLAVHAYLRGKGMDKIDVAYMRAYLRQWIMADGWHPGPGLNELRRRIDGLTSYEAIAAWLHDAQLEGIDPL